MNWLDNKLRNKAWYRKWRGLPEPLPIYLAEFNKEMLANLERCLTFNKDYLEPFDSNGKAATIRRPKRYVEGKE